VPELSLADHRVSPPRITLPPLYNAAFDLLERNLRAGRSEKTAFLDDAGAYSYGELAARVDAVAHGLAGLGLKREDRLLVCLLDTIDFPAAFLGAIKAGIVPIPVNTLLSAAEYEFLLRDSGARALVVSAALLPVFRALPAWPPALEHVIVSGGEPGAGIGPSARQRPLSSLLEASRGAFQAAATSPADACFWLYSSGSTGTPKGAVHRHGSLIQTAELYARPILGLEESDLVFSAAKLFFAYGLGNALTFPMAVGATALLMSERPTPAAVFRRLRERRPTVFYGVPTLYAALLASPDPPRPEDLSLRRSVSAGEALPAEIGRRWLARFGVDILDGIGSTELLHIFLSNRPGRVRYGTTGEPVPGYALRIVDEHGAPVKPGEQGELLISGPTCASYYWNNPEKTRATFADGWARSGDKYALDGDGCYVYAGRSDDMLKVSGQYVSPVEVEAALVSHEAVLEAAVVGREDADGLVKPAAYVVLKPRFDASPALAEELKQHVKGRLAPFKCPRFVEFVSELPKTATGKIQRFKLRAARSDRSPA
jgi:benzoate-CoA ligase